ncbi:helix-turn-helix domain-containing protein [Streptomyces sp. NPDC005925]|uniref:helix-turn-helix domain-containing protein n=1 Tax=Streptomyces sp. NPDC005925 TaxID=3157172 RepID=UPI0033C96726
MEPSAVTILELLAEGAPAESLGAFAARARRGTADDPQGLAVVEEAIRLGRAVHERCELRRRREAGLTALAGLALELAAPASLCSLLDVVTRRARMLLGTDLACVALPGADGGPAVVRAADGHVSALTIGLTLPTVAGLGNAAIPVWSPDYPHDDRVRHSDALDAAVAAESVRAVLVTPLGRDDAPAGALCLADRSPRHFTHEEISLVSLLGELVGAAVDKVTALERACTELSALEARYAQSERQLRTTAGLRDLHHRLIGRALDGVAPSALAEAAAARTGGALRILAADGTVLDTTGGACAWGDEGGDGPATVAAHTAGRPVSVGDGTWAAPIRARGARLGTVLLRLDRPVTDTDVHVLAILAEAMAVLLLGDTAGQAAAPAQRSDGPLDDLLTGPWRLVEQTGRNLAPGRPHAVLVALPRTDELGKAVAWAARHARRTGGLAGEQRDLLVMVLPGTDPGRAARAVMDELAPLLEGAVTIAGAGPVTGRVAASAAFEEARQCLDAMIALGATGCVASARDLGFLGALLSDSRDVTAFVHSAIGPVLDYDRQRFTELTKTLETYFRCGSSPTYAAQQLFVHPNTVARRLERIGSLLAPDWQQPDHTLKIQLALRLHGIRQSLIARRTGEPDEVAGRAG